jgi:hypothetical protein
MRVVAKSLTRNSILNVRSGVFFIFLLKYFIYGRDNYQQ